MIAARIYDVNLVPGRRLAVILPQSGKARRQDNRECRDENICRLPLSDPTKMLHLYLTFLKRRAPRQTVSNYVSIIKNFFVK